MKTKLNLLIILLFSIICYAQSPPPPPGLEQPFYKGIDPSTLTPKNRTTLDLPDGFFISLFDDSIDKPMDIAFHVANDKIIVGERDGFFWLYTIIDGNWVKKSVPFLSIPDQVTTYFERGVESILVDSHFIYVYYTVEESYLFPDLNLPLEDKSATVNRVSRWEVAWAQNIAVFGEDILVDGIPSLAGNHQGGGMSFGTEGLGHLYISTGDGANSTYSSQAVERGIIPLEHENYDGRFRSQIKSSPNGKILRVLSWNGDGLVGNPYFNVNNRDTWESRLYDYGYRNPFRISYDELQDSLFVADVGAGAKEEVTVAKPSKNAGWGKYEGFNETSISTSTINPDTGQPFIFNYQNKPLLDYGHNGSALTRLLGGDGQPFIDTANPIQGNSITGGIVLKDGFGPYTGFYMFTDFTNGAINLLSPDRTYTVNFAPEGTFSTPISVKQAPDGSVFIISFFGDIDIITYESTLSNQNFDTTKIDILYDIETNEHTIVGLQENATLILTNLNGQNIFEKEVENNEKFTFSQASGMYIATITKNNQTFTKKIIIKK